MFAFNGPFDRTLASFHSDAEARTTEFFQAFANELPGDMAERFKAYGDKFIRRHARVQLKSLFKLKRAQCNKVIEDVNQELQFDEGAGEEDGIRASIEEAAGFEFEKPTAPESAALVTTKRKISEEDADADANEPKGRSLSQSIPRSQQLDAVLPDYVFDGVTTPDPLNNPIGETELSAITDETIKFLCKQFGRHNLGIGMARIYAAQIRKKVKLGDRGKGVNRVLGINRDLAQSIVEKSRNRTYKPKNYKHALEVHPEELSDEVKIVYESEYGSSSCVKLSTDAVVKKEIKTADEQPPNDDEDEDITMVDAATGVPEKSNPQGFIVFGETKHQPLTNLTHSATNSAPGTQTTADLSAEEQLRVAQERVAKEKAEAAATAAAAAKAEATAAAAAAKAEAVAAEAEAVAAEAAAEAAAAEKADEMWQARAVFAKDVPDPPLPALDFTTSAAVGKLVLIPAKKYPKHAVVDAAGRDNFVGWAGKLVGYEQHKTKMKVKIQGDHGFEHLTVKGSSAYALTNLTRLI